MLTMCTLLYYRTRLIQSTLPDFSGLHPWSNLRNRSNCSSIRTKSTSRTSRSTALKYTNEILTGSSSGLKTKKIPILPRPSSTSAGANCGSCRRRTKPRELVYPASQQRRGTMGVWFLATSLGNFAAGRVAGFFRADQNGALLRLFGTVALVTIVAAAILALATPYIRGLAPQTE